LSGNSSYHEDKSERKESAVSQRQSENPERTSQTDDLHISEVVPLPPPEHLIRFFPIAGTPVEKFVKQPAEPPYSAHPAWQRQTAAGDHGPLLHP
jgi:hypothetical protein